MFAFRTITALGLVLVLTAGTFAADKKGPLGKPPVKSEKRKELKKDFRPKAKVAPKQSTPARLASAAGHEKAKRSEEIDVFSWSWGVKRGDKRPTANGANSSFGPRGPRQATDAEIIKALNNGTQVKSATTARSMAPAGRKLGGPAAWSDDNGAPSQLGLHMKSRPRR